MSILWTLRLLCVGLLAVFIIIYRIGLKDREKYSKQLENLTLNIIIVVFYKAVNYIAVLIPSDPTVIPNSLISENEIVLLWHTIVGFIFLLFALLIMMFTIRMRKALGAQDIYYLSIDGKLLTNGLYGFCRHPIYLAISILSLSLALIFHNLDGLLIVPILILININFGKIEQKYDMEVRFKEEYKDYAKQVRIFGPIWFWILIIILVSLPILISIISV
jgi:protein-S-isoprenylcysteine O-methyltransferase Ste14